MPLYQLILCLGIPLCSIPQLYQGFLSLPTILGGTPPAAPFDNHSTCAGNADRASSYSTSSTTFDIPCTPHDRAHSFPAPHQKFSGDARWRRRLIVRSFAAFGCCIRVLWGGLEPEARWRRRRAIPSCRVESANPRRIAVKFPSHQPSPPLTVFNVRVWGDGCECRVCAVQGQVGCAL
jgi:hypothetical protein